MNASKKQTQYKPQTGPYKVFVKDKGLWQNYSHARLQISVGHPKHEGPKFFALTEWAAARFNHVTLIVSDSLQRYNIALAKNCSLDEAYHMSMSQGNKWLKENAQAIALLPHKTITRWDNWLKHPAYAPIYAHIMDIYNRNDVFKHAVKNKAESFNVHKLPDVADERIYNLLVENSIRYILEEIPAFAIMFKEQTAVDIYPGTWFKDLFEILNQSSNSELIVGFRNTACMRVDFVRNTIISDLQIPLAA